MVLNFRKFNRDWDIEELKQQNGIFKLRRLLTKYGGSQLYQSVLKDLDHMRKEGQEQEIEAATGIIISMDQKYYADNQKLLTWLKQRSENDPKRDVIALPGSCTREHILTADGGILLKPGVYYMKKVLSILTSPGHPLVYANVRRRVEKLENPEEEIGAYLKEGVGYVIKTPKFLEWFLQHEPSHQ